MIHLKVRMGSLGSEFFALLREALNGDTFDGELEKILSVVEKFDGGRTRNGFRKNRMVWTETNGGGTDVVARGDIALG